jgi:hypothetical protein
MRELEEKMRFFLIANLAALLFLPVARAQEAMPGAISDAYESTLSALQSAKSPADIHRMMEAMDSPDWVSVAPTGEKTSRDDAENQLKGLLSIPPGQRPIPIQKTIFVSDQRSRVLVLYWVYRVTDQGKIGSIVRDSWLKTSDGWRRTMHEKLIPDRLLSLP